MSVSALEQGGEGKEEGGHVELELTSFASLLALPRPFPEAIEARKAVKEATDHASLEVKYMDLVSHISQQISHVRELELTFSLPSFRPLPAFTFQFQEMKRQERIHIQERSRFIKEKVRHVHLAPARALRLVPRADPPLSSFGRVPPRRKPPSSISRRPLRERPSWTRRSRS